MIEFNGAMQLLDRPINKRVLLFSPDIIKIVNPFIHNVEKYTAIMLYTPQDF